MAEAENNLPLLLPDLDIRTEEASNKYSYIKQDNITNALSRVSSKSGIEKIEFTNNGVIKTRNGNTDIQVIIEECGNTKLTQSTSKLLRIITIEFTKNENKKLVEIPLKKYMEMTGLKDKKDARKTVKADLDALYRVSVEAYTENRKGEKGYKGFRICDERGIENGIIFMNLSDRIANHLRQCELMPYPNEHFKIPSNSQKNPYTFYLGDKIAELIKYNQYNKTTGEKKGSFNIAVKTLLEVCIKNGMPSYKEVKEKGRQVSLRIIEPFERDLIASSGSGEMFKWEYCNAKGTPLTAEQLNPSKPIEYKEWEALYIKITYAEDYPIAPVNKKKLNKQKEITHNEQIGG